MIIIDDYASSTEQIINFAVAQSSFNQDDKSFYPGLRSQLPRDYVVRCLDPLIPHFYSVYGIPKNLSPQIVDARFSLITQEPKSLQAIQTIPHFDSPSRYTIAVLHYLNDLPHRGTGLFRHKPTGFEYINEARHAEYFNYVQNYLRNFKEKEVAYCPLDSADYECYKEVEFKLNRLVAYPGCLLHTAIVDQEKDVDSNPRTGRLTANMLLEFV